ncbi:mannosyltransferase [uncultured Polaribacter sp.]|uniref:mannosyltransferase n=1 Tax=uncultured Polaribacter sp. TaxID=174711 RepID=UPI002622E6A6|nr:mannosyltransferase [uncultured Polaribacter sp.]
MVGLKKYQVVFATVLSIFTYFFVAYFLERTQFYVLSFSWIVLFSAFYFFLKNEKLTFRNLAAIAILFRLIFLFSTPNLSQDFYRFIWDGRMILNDLNPYLSLPQTYIAQNLQPIAEANALYKGMGALNGSHYTNYPPLNQLCFFIAAVFANKSIFGAVIVLRIIIIAADLGILYFGKKLLERLHLPVKNIFWYILNPFVIIEMTGNLHFESVMLFFLVWALYQLHQRKWIFAGILIACSVSVKLIPLLFLPLFYQFLNNNSSRKWLPTQKGIKNLILFYSVILGTTILFFAPFYSNNLIANYGNSVGLWFRNFEFNASFYYIFREIGYLFRGYNEIAIIGKITPILTIVFLIYLTFFRKNNTLIALITAMLFGLSFYYFTATTVHPWYVATPLILCVFTKYKFPVVWSFVIILSYQAYANNPWKENLYFIFIEYAVLFGFLGYEIYKQRLVTKL